MAVLTTEQLDTMERRGLTTEELDAMEAGPPIQIDPEVFAKKRTSEVFGTIFGLDEPTTMATYDTLAQKMYGTTQPLQIQQMMEEDGFQLNPDRNERDTAEVTQSMFERKESSKSAEMQRRDANRQIYNVFQSLQLADDIIFDPDNPWYTEHIATKPEAKEGRIYTEPIHTPEDLLDFDTYVTLLEQSATRQNVEDLRQERKALLARTYNEAIQQTGEYFDTQEWSEFTTGWKVGDVTLEVAKGLYTALKTVEMGVWSTSVAMGMAWNMPDVEAVETALKDARLTPMKAAGKIGYVTRAMSEAIPNFAYNMTVGTSGIFITEYGNARQEALNDGATDLQAEAIAIPVATINTIIEGWQIDRIFKMAGLGTGAKQAVKQAIKDRAYKAFLKGGAKFTGQSILAAINEGIEGFTQEGVSIAVPGLIIGNYPKDENGRIDWTGIMTRMGQSFVGEGLGGLLLGTGGAVYNARNVQNYKHDLAFNLIVNEGMESKQALEVATNIVERLRNNEAAPKEVYREEVGKVKPADNRAKAAAHIIKRGKEMSDAQYRQIAVESTGKESMVDMTYEEGEKFIDALNKAKVEKVEPAEPKEEVTEQQIADEIEEIKNEEELQAERHMKAIAEEVVEPAPAPEAAPAEVAGEAPAVTGKQPEVDIYAQMEEKQFNDFVKLSADTPQQLRASDLERVLREADDQGKSKQFGQWLLNQNIPERTAIRLKEQDIILGGRVVWDKKWAQAALKKAEEGKGKQPEGIKTLATRWKGGPSTLEEVTIDGPEEVMPMVLSIATKYNVPTPNIRIIPKLKVLGDTTMPSDDLKNGVGYIAVSSKGANLDTIAHELAHWIIDLPKENKRLPRTVLQRNRTHTQKHTDLTNAIRQEMRSLMQQQKQAALKKAKEGKRRRGGFLSNTPFGNKDKLQQRVDEVMALAPKPPKPPAAEKKKSLKQLKKTDTLTTFRNVAEDAVKSVDKLFGVMSTRIKNISQKLFQEVRNKYINPVKMIIADRTQKVHPFVDAIETQLSEADKYDFEVARWTEDIDTVEQILEKYDLQDSYDTYRRVFDLIYHEGKAVGMDMNYRTAYFPSKVKDLDGLLKELNRREEYAPVLKALAEAQDKKGRPLAKEEQIQVLDTLLRGYRTTGISLTPPGFTRVRTLIRDDISLIKYYYGFAETTSRYIESMTENIQARKFFGKQTKEIVQLRANISRAKTNIAKWEKDTTKDRTKNIQRAKEKLQEYETKLLELDDGTLNASIGNYVLDLIEDGTINYDQQVELRQIFDGLFNTVGSTRWVHTARSLEYVGSLAQVPALVTQYSEVVLSVLKAPGSTLPNWVRAHLNRSKIKLRDIGVAHIGQEWADADFNATMTSLMKAFEKVDAIGKETFINSVVDKYRRLAETNPDKVKEELAKYYPEQDHAAIIESLKSGAIDNNIKGFALNELADVQPISKMEVPEYYAKAGNLRVFYMYKTFTLKRLDILRNQAYGDIKGGIQSGSARRVLKGLAKLLWLAFMFTLADGSADVVKDVIRGKPLQEMPDYVVDNLLQMILLSKYSAGKARKEGLSAFFRNNIALPVSTVDAAAKDVMTLLDEDSEQGSELARRIPWMGDLYYWYFGEGARKVEEGYYD